MKVAKLVKLSYLPAKFGCLENVVLNTEDMTELKRRLTALATDIQPHVKITYIEWRKSKEPGPATFLSRRKVVACNPMSDLVSSLLEEMTSLEQHLIRVRSQFKAYRQARTDASLNEDTAVCQIDV